MSQSSPEGVPSPGSVTPENEGDVEALTGSQAADLMVRAARLHESMRSVRYRLGIALFEGNPEGVVIECRVLLALGLTGKDIADDLERLVRG